MDDSLAQLVEGLRERVEALGFELADVQRRGAGSRVRLQVRIDRPDAAPGRGITVDDCAQVSRVLEAWFDAEQSLGPRYVLEVSSPGIERPLRWRQHWVRYRGREVNVRIAGRGRSRARIVEVRGDDVVVLAFPDGASEPVRLDAIQDAKLVVDWEAVEREAASRRRDSVIKESE
jgi:ribosome maturation factor RimP